MKFNKIINKKGHQFIPFCLLVLVGSFFFSCGPMDETYRDFIKDGEIVYTGKVDSLKAFPGRDRMKLTWLLVSDPKITKNIVFWNNKADSLVLTVHKTSGVDTISVIIENMVEKLYTFEVYTYDNAGHSSVNAEIIGTVYGQTYANTLNNRPLDKVTYAADTTLIDWFGIGSQAAVLYVNYTDVNDVSRTVMDVPLININFPKRPKTFPNYTKLPNAKQGTTFTFRTGYLPTDACIDTFFTDWSKPVLIP